MSERAIVGEIKEAMEATGLFVIGTTITTTSVALVGATSIIVAPLPEIVSAANKTLWFTNGSLYGLTARITLEAPAGTTVLEVEPLRIEIPAGASAQYGSSVSVNDWFFLDGSNEDSPYCVIETADDFSTVRSGGSPNRTWQIAFHPTVKWHEWQEALNEFRYLREQCLKTLTDSFLYPADPTWKLNRTWSDESVYGRPDPYMPPGQIESAMPIYVGQRIFTEVEDYDV